MLLLSETIQHLSGGAADDVGGGIRPGSVGRLLSLGD
jgi:hypothetical protein